jgi:energy-coupling factor transporter ATP-binding protein EcfA2
MSTEPLFICRDVLVEAYREKLGLEFGHSISEIRNGRQPVWCMISADDLTTERPVNATGKAGLLLDPEIGLLVYILPFHGETALRKQITRALTLRSKLSIERNYTGSLNEDGDDRGAWRVVLHWLVDASARMKWTKQIMEVRRETAFSEEISMDAIFIADGDIKKQIVNYGFPRLLLTTREVFKKQQLSDVKQWQSANILVKQALSGFASNFNKPEQSKLADEVVRAMDAFKESSNLEGDGRQVPERPRTFKSIRICNFRNLRDVRFDFGQAAVSASIVHGPNGTGKSSLCEAISLALYRSSFRYKWFSDRLREKDVTATDRANEYIAKYLTPIEGAQGDPKIAMDEHEYAIPQLVNAGETEGADLAMDGTILTQDSSLEFARMASHELGARVLRGYSELAEHIDQFTESRVAQANTLRQDFLRGLGLSAAITKADTAYERIAKREIDLSLPPLPHSLVTWLDLVENLPGRSATGIGQQWRAWGDLGRNELAKEFSVSNNNEAKLISETRRWLNRFNELTTGSTEVVRSIEARVDPIRTELDSTAARVAAWGEWLERRANVTDTTTSPEAELLAKKLQELQTLQKQIVERGSGIGGHFEHLTRVEMFVRETWSKEHADSCPTCGTDQSERGGILKVIEALRAQTSVERDRLRKEFTDLKMQIDQTQKKLAELGQVQCPLNPEEQSKLAESLQWLVPTSANLSDWIGVRSQRDALLTSIAALRQIPPAPSVIDADGNAERLVKKVLSQFREADETFDGPTNWKPVKEKLTKTLASIVNEHLPHTLEKLWRELALNLTAAPWLLPDSFRIDVVTRRGEQASTIRVKDRLARYILNQAEIHTLGLAWFFTRHLTRGRFFQACIVMDDPAHELDQTSFRDLCRLWETLMRLHRVYNRPLKLIVMLNQESRAVEAARATGAILSVLGWEREQDQSVRATSVVGEGFHAPQPASVFAPIGT